MKIEMSWKKETKNTHVYENLEEDSPVQTLYIMKSAFKDHEAPNEISVTIEEK